jgi:group II intron reverse transcriptase/maturase
MRNAKTVLGIIRERGKQGKPLERLYRVLYNPELYLQAYANLYPNKGAMTPGATEETADGMSMAKIEALIDDVRHERHRWTPVRRIYVPKKGGGRRSLGLPTWSDKLLQDVVRQILEAYYEPQFSHYSHGFRPGRGCHTALTQIVKGWSGTRWFIEGDISKCFDRLDHDVLIETLGEKIHDNRFLNLIRQMLQAGYLEDWKWHATLSGAPQGGIVSPILSNIYLHKLDEYVETTLIPKYHRGEKRRTNLTYQDITNQIRRAKRRGDRSLVRELKKQRREHPSGDPHDPSFRRLYYVRYADDFLLGFIGPKSEAEEVKREIGAFLHDELRLELSDSKTLISHAKTKGARFLSYWVRTQQPQTRLDHTGRRVGSGVVGLLVPEDIINDKCSRYMRRGKPEGLPERRHDSDFSIVRQYQAEFRGVVQYYMLAQNVFRFHKLHWVMLTSLLKTLANKHRTSTTKIAKHYRAEIDTPHGKMVCLKVVVPRDNGRKPLVAQFGGIPLRRTRDAVVIDEAPNYGWSSRTEILERLLADKCELCGLETKCEVHHIRKMADLKKKGRRSKEPWEENMIARRRKTLVVCPSCHSKIHTGKMS